MDSVREDRRFAGLESSTQESIARRWIRDLLIEAAVAHRKEGRTSHDQPQLHGALDTPCIIA